MIGKLSSGMYRLYSRKVDPRTGKRRSLGTFLVDEIATGSSMMAAIRSVRAQKPRRIVVAIGVAPAESLGRIRTEADEVLCLEAPTHFYALGQFFEEFSEVTDEMVVAALSRPVRA